MQDLNIFIARHILLASGIVIIFVLLTVVEMFRAKAKTAELSTHAATQKINREDAVIVDTRHADAYRQGHIIDAHNITADAIYSNLTSLQKFRIKPIIVVGTSSAESQKVAAFLIKSGYNAYSLAGGMRAWLDAQLPTVKN